MKRWKKLHNILFWVLIGITAVVVLFTFLSVCALGRAERSVFGYRAFIILSDSMKKTDFAAGDLVIVREVDPTTLCEGDIISYTSRDSDSFGQTITHKIRSRTTDSGGDPGFITYGTATDTDDRSIVTYPYILGKYELRIPRIGRFFLFLKTTPGYLLCIFLPFAILILTESVRCFSLIRRYRAGQRRALRAERLRLEAQQAQAEQALRRLQAMRAEMGLSDDPPSI